MGLFENMSEILARKLAAEKWGFRSLDSVEFHPFFQYLFRDRQIKGPMALILTALSSTDNKFVKADFDIWKSQGKKLYNSIFLKKVVQIIKIDKISGKSINFAFLSIKKLSALIKNFALDRKETVISQYVSVVHFMMSTRVPFLLQCK